MRVLVCGGRGYGEVPTWARPMSPEHGRLLLKAHDEVCHLYETLDDLAPRPTLIIHGAAKGADRHAKAWAESRGIEDLPFPADWYANGFGRLDKSAGPRRNQKMIDEGKPDLVIAFPGGRGTADMTTRARAAGIEVIEVAAPTKSEVME